MRAKEFATIVEGYREAQQEFAQGTDADAVKKMIDAYRSLVDRNQVQGQERNIDFWRKQGWEKFSKFVQSKSQERSRTQVKQAKGITTQQITLRDDDTWLIVIPLDKDTSCFHGRGTDWCTTKSSQNNFEEYFYKKNVTLIYCINKQTGGKWAMAAHRKATKNTEYFDQRDKGLKSNEFDQQTGLDSAKIIQQALSQQNIGSMDNARASYRRAIARLNRLDFLSDELRPPEEKQEIEKLLLFIKDLEKICDYAKDAIKGRWSEAEPMIARDPYWAYWYAKNVIQGRWPKAEPIIAREPGWNMDYAKEIIKGRWPEIEPDIARDPIRAMNYAQTVIRGRWPEAEPAIARIPALAVRYAYNVIRGRWPEIEPDIARDPKRAAEYARYIIKGPWPEAGIE